MADEGEGEVFDGAQLSRGGFGRGACYWIKSRDSVEVGVDSDRAGIWVLNQTSKHPYSSSGKDAVVRIMEEK
jgi:hypothetical protein